MTWLKISSSDSGAPSLLGVNSSLVNVFRWAVPQLGFAVEFGPAGTAAVFRAATGNRFRFCVQNNNATTTGTSRVRGAETATSATAWASLFPTTVQASDANSTWVAGDDGQPTLPCDYVFYGNSVFFYFLCQRTAGDNNSWALNFFGDAPTEYVSTYATVMSVQQSSYPSSGILQDSFATGGSGGSYIFMCRNITGSIKSTSCSLYGGQSGTFCGISHTQPVRGGYLNYLLRHKVGINCSGKTGVWDGTPTTLAIPQRCWLPNLWNPTHTQNTGSVASLDTFTDTTYNAAASFRYYAHSSNAGFIIEETDTWSIP